MTVAHAATVRTAMADQVLGMLDGGYISFTDETNTEVARLTLGTPAFEPAVSGHAVANAISPDMDAAGGTIVQALFFTSGDDAVFSVSVTEADGGGDIELTTTLVTPGQVVGLDELTYDAPL